VVTVLDRLDELERGTGIHGAVAYQDLLHRHGRALIDVARTAVVVSDALARIAESDEGEAMLTRAGVESNRLAWDLVPLLEAEA
jgi:hypothetical protein